jgi:hypothetical protein
VDFLLASGSSFERLKSAIASTCFIFANSQTLCQIPIVDFKSLEVFEESGLRIKKIHALVHAFRWSENPSILNLPFVCEIEDGELHFESDKNSDYKWIREKRI